MAEDQREALYAARATFEAMAQSSKEKQEAFRARQAMLGMTEIRGLYAPQHLQGVIKAFVRKWVDERQEEDERERRRLERLYKQEQKK